MRMAGSARRKRTNTSLMGNVPTFAGTATCSKSPKSRSPNGGLRSDMRSGCTTCRPAAWAERDRVSVQPSPPRIQIAAELEKLDHSSVSLSAPPSLGGYLANLEMVEWCTSKVVRLHCCHDRCGRKRRHRNLHALRDAAGRHRLLQRTSTPNLTAEECLAQANAIDGSARLGLLRALRRQAAPDLRLCLMLAWRQANQLVQRPSEDVAATAQPFPGARSGAGGVPHPDVSGVA
jgi:hypothetical protein